MIRQSRHTSISVDFCNILIYSIFCKQKHGGNALLVDAEHAFDPDYSRALGVDVENLIVCQPDNGEMALESTLLTSFCVAFVSVAFLSQVRIVQWSAFLVL